jgi:hypothetical protein
LETETSSPEKILKLLKKAGQDAHAAIKRLMINIIHGLLSKKSGLKVTPFVLKYLSFVFFEKQL